MRPRFTGGPSRRSPGPPRSTAPADPATLDRAVAAAQAVEIPGGRRLQLVPVPGTPDRLACCLTPPTDPAGAGAAGVELAAGGAIRTLVLGLHALGVGASFQPATPAGRRNLAGSLGLGPGWEPLGLLAT